MRMIPKNFRTQGSALGKSLLVPALASVLVLLSPDQPLEKIIGCGTEQMDAAGIEKIHETLKLYSILTSQKTGLSKSSVWSMAETILEESRKHLLDPMLILAVINVESRFQRAVVSTVGARGLMQIHPVFAPALAAEAEIQDWEGPQSLDNPILNIKLGTFYLAQMKKRFKSLQLALSAYNLGPTAVRERLNGGGDIPFDYVRKVLAAHRSYREKQNRAPIALPVRSEKPGAQMS